MKETILCDCCQVKAKYEINDSKSCGRHIAVQLDMQLGMSGDAIVRRIESEESK